MAVLPLRADGLQLNEANRLNLSLRARAGTRGGYDVQGADLTTQLVEAAQGLGIDCDVNAVACGVELGRIADVEFVLLGRAALVPASTPPAVVVDKSVGVDVTVVDVKAGIAVRRVRALLPHAPDAQVPAIDALTDQLFGASAAASGTLRLTTQPAGAAVVVDGIPAGMSDNAGALALANLSPGPHVIVVSAKKHLTLTQVVAVLAGEVALPVTLTFDKDSEVEVIAEEVVVVPFIAAGVAGVVAVAGGVMLGIGVQPYFAHQGANERLASLDQADPGYPSLAKQAHDESAAAAAEWSTWGGPLTVSGSISLGLGVATAAGALAWGFALSQSAEAPTSAP